MLPGIGALGNEVRYLAPKLNPAGYRAVAVDLRGHGESSVPWDAYDVPSVANDIIVFIKISEGWGFPYHWHILRRCSRHLGG